MGLDPNNKWNSLEAAYTLKRNTILWYVDGTIMNIKIGARVFRQAKVYAIEKCQIQFNFDGSHKERHIARLFDNLDTIRELCS